jgi:hypothetical protein
MKPIVVLLLLRVSDPYYVLSFSLLLFTSLRQFMSWNQRSFGRIILRQFNDGISTEI